MNDQRAQGIPLLPETPRIIKARNQWRYNGSERPAFAQPPGPGQESVWDFPRPPARVPCARHLKVYADGQLIAQTERGVRVLETAGAPTYYFPPDDVDADRLEYDAPPEVRTPASGGAPTSVCEWKGEARTIAVAGRQGAAWRYVRVFPGFAELYQWISFYPALVDCFVGDEQATAQPGGYYGGWVTRAVAGPIKGEPGSQNW